MRLLTPNKSRTYLKKLKITLLKTCCKAVWKKALSQRAVGQIGLSVKSTVTAAKAIFRMRSKIEQMNNPLDMPVFPDPDCWSTVPSYAFSPLYMPDLIPRWVRGVTWSNREPLCSEVVFSWISWLCSHKWNGSNSKSSTRNVVAAHSCGHRAVLLHSLSAVDTPKLDAIWDCTFELDTLLLDS